jgi:hypothetical protein
LGYPMYQHPEWRNSTICINTSNVLSSQNQLFTGCKKGTNSYLM